MKTFLKIFGLLFGIFVTTVAVWQSILERDIDRMLHKVKEREAFEMQYADWKKIRLGETGSIFVPRTMFLLKVKDEEIYNIPVDSLPGTIDCEGKLIFFSRKLDEVSDVLKPNYGSVSIVVQKEVPGSYIRCCDALNLTEEEKCILEEELRRKLSLDNREMSEYNGYKAIRINGQGCAKVGYLSSSEERAVYYQNYFFPNDSVRVVFFLEHLPVEEENYHWGETLDRVVMSFNFYGKE